MNDDWFVLHPYTLLLNFYSASNLNQQYCTQVYMSLHSAYNVTSDPTIIFSFCWMMHPYRRRSKYHFMVFRICRGSNPHHLRFYHTQCCHSIKLVDKFIHKFKLIFQYLYKRRDRRDRMVVGFTTVQSMPITTKVVSPKPIHVEMYSIQHYVIKFVSDLWQIYKSWRLYECFWVMRETFFNVGGVCVGGGWNMIFEPGYLFNLS